MTPPDVENRGENLYRRWRPGRLAEVAGQEAPRVIISSALRQGRVSHAYLLTGPRGTGKTSIARIIAKAVNCRGSAETGDACDACDTCRAIAKGSHPDVLEMDAATHRTLDDVRRIQDQVRYLPVQAKKRVVIIDECHALDRHAIPALLKTLEEPPPHVVYILCTTEAHNILPTIVSRCQRHDLRRLSPEQVAGRLREVAGAEGIPVSEAELNAISRACAGGLRDALNMLEQLGEMPSAGAGRLTALGIYDEDQRVLPIISAIIEMDRRRAIEELNAAVWQGADVNTLKKSGILVFRHASFAAAGVHSPAPAAVEEAVANALQSPYATPSRIHRAMKLWSEVDLSFDTPSTVSLEIAIMEACLNLEWRTPAADATLAPGSGYSQDELPASAPPDGPASRALPERLRRDWRKLSDAMALAQVDGYWVMPLLRDVNPALITQDDAGRLTLPFTNQHHMELFQGLLASPQGPDLAMRIAELTSTVSPPQLMLAGWEPPGLVAAKTDEGAARRGPSELARHALILNGRLIRGP